MLKSFHTNLSGLLAGLILAACSDGAPTASMDVDSNGVIEGATPLEKLFPGQRMSDQYSRIHQAAFLLIDLEQNDDAVSGRLSLTVNAARSADCAEITDGVQPWSDLCLISVDRGQSLSFGADAVFRRTNVGPSVMGAYAALETETALGTVYPVIKATSYGGWELRPRPSSAIELGPYVEALELGTGPTDRLELPNSKALITEARTK